MIPAPLSMIKGIKKARTYKLILNDEQSLRSITGERNELTGKRIGFLT